MLRHWVCQFILLVYILPTMSEIRAIAQTAEEFPRLLKNIPDAPGLLYINGESPQESEKLMAVVGTRKPTPYGKEVAMHLTRELCRAGFSIVSGMALGIDAIAHDIALEEGAKTYAVLGCGADIIYPPTHKNLHAKIAQYGGIISEYAPGTPPMTYRFPERNRIIAGMSAGTLVIEAKEKSGALITGNLALEYNREVFAVPGPIFSPTSKGPHKLIKDGAKLVQDINDILSEFGFKAPSIQERLLENASDEEKIILKIITTEPAVLDDILRLSKLSTSTVHSTLTMLELKGMVQELGGGMYGVKR